MKNELARHARRSIRSSYDKKINITKKSTNNYIYKFK
jgi:hypothetical protein